MAAALTDGEPVNDPMRALGLAVLAYALHIHDHYWWLSEDNDLCFWCQLAEIDPGRYRQRLIEICTPRGDS